MAGSSRHTLVEMIADPPLRPPRAASLALAIVTLVAMPTGALAADDPSPAPSAERAVGDALSALHSLVPDWQLPGVVTDPVEEGDFATAAVTAAAARTWVELAAAVDAAWPEFGALARSQGPFEDATSLEELEAGAQLADRWSQAAEWIAQAEDAKARPRSLLTDLGLLGVNLDARLRRAREAGLAGDVSEAIDKSTQVVALIENGAAGGSLRLAGLIFLGSVVLGALALASLWRGQTGGGDPPWAPSG